MSVAINGVERLLPAELAPLTCRKCGMILGVSTGESLTVGAAVFIHIVTVHCGRCGEVRKWRPSN